MKYRGLILLFTLLFVLAGCKTSKTISTSGNTSFNLSAKQLIKENTKKSPNFKTLVAKIRVDYSKNNESTGSTVSFRMEKDKVIWMSKLGIVKALITPEKVSFYNKLDNTYFDGDFSYLSELLGTELNFNQVQNLLLGEALFNLKDNKYDISVHEQSYLLTPKEQETLYEIFFLLNPSHYKLDSQQLEQTRESRLLEIDYLAYQEVDKQTLPERIKVIALESAEETIIDLEFKAVSLNENLRFPFKIPSGYKQIVLD